jgi:HSP20 family protein
MKKIITLLSIITLFSSALVCAQNTADNETSRDFSVLRKKIVQMKREMDLLMKDIISTAPATGEAVMGTFGNDVYVDVLQNDKNVIVKADLPGMDKDKINVTLDNDRFLKITGSREMVKNEKAPGVVRQERFSGNFSKVVELPCEVTPVGINATYKDGVLEITIPKKAQVKEETVKISIK